MDPSSDSGASAQAQRQESAEETIAPLPTESQPLHGDTVNPTMSPSSNSGAPAQAQRQTGESIVPVPTESQPLHGDTVGTGDAEWLVFNLLSLDGGGIRGHWSLLVLKNLMDFIGLEEEKYRTGAAEEKYRVKDRNEECYHSFQPQEWPENVYQAPLTKEEEEKRQEVHDPQLKVRELPRNRRYLPCHYFDYICGSSTGALIAIMLGRFRMTVPDCLFEYQTLGQEIFGKPRMFHTLRFGLGFRPKFEATRLEKVFKDVTKRRNEQPGRSETGKIVFPSGRGLCATFVTTMKSEDGGRLSRPYLIRSYDHEKQNSLENSTRPTPGPTTQSSRTNTGLSGERKKSLDNVNYERAQQLEVWQVARAATAAKLYFEPLRIENARAGGFTEFRDGGFSQANNPTRTEKHEIEDLHGYASVGIIVSVGTARKLKEDAKKKTFFNTIPNLTKEFADTATDPETIHHEMDRDHRRYKFPYYRLNHPGGLKTELDEWEPKSRMYNKKKSGEKTIADMESAFGKWAANPDNIKQFEECAAALVARRRKRMRSDEWERYATGSHFTCGLRGCDPGDFFHRHQFEHHLKRHHDLKDNELEAEISGRRKHWRYQPAP